MKEKFNVNIDFNPISVTVEVEKGANAAAIVETAKIAFASKVMNEFPKAHFTYSVANDNALSFDTVRLGMAVKIIGEERYGIVTKINKKTISVDLRGPSPIPHGVKGDPCLFEKVEDLGDLSKFANHKYPIAVDTFWCVGHVAYYADLKNKKVVPVALIKEMPRSNKYHFYVINGTTYWEIHKDNLRLRLFNSPEEAKAVL